MSNSNEIKAINAALSKHYSAMRNLHMRDLFQHDPARARKLTLSFSNLTFDYSKNITTPETLELLFKLARARNIKSSIGAMFIGKKINNTENRAVLHTALRSPPENKLEVEGEDVIQQVHTELEKISKFVTSVHDGSFAGWTGKKLDTFVNIGIGGSDLGPKMVVKALDYYRKPGTRSFFISNIDDQQIIELKKTVNPETTLFIVASKSFTTLETHANTETLINWMKETGCEAINKHFIAISSNIKAATEAGIDQENIFSMWDWVGGRYSLWSAIGLPIALALGFENFKRLLSGAYHMDVHFKETEFEKNIPVILALHDYWYNNFFDAETHAFIPYDDRLALFPDYLSQLFMESNGKSTDLSGHRIDYNTMPITWGSTGTNAQHAFFQLLHQGTRLVPVDFLLSLTTRGDKKHHALLLSNCFAQSQALMLGEDNNIAYKYFPGNKPSTTILYQELDPETLGMLLALYEHRTFVQGLLWNINSFDQWGVELGKKLASGIYESLKNTEMNPEMDSSTQNLINLYRKNNQ